MFDDDDDDDDDEPSGSSTLRDMLFRYELLREEYPATWS
jgi:hypothetical protein